MVSAKVLLHATESIVLATSSLAPRERIELMHTIRSSLPSLQSLLSYPVPKASDRSQVQSNEVRLADSPPISLDDQDVQIALKLSDDLHLNEIDCVRLLVATNQEVSWCCIWFLDYSMIFFLYLFGFHISLFQRGMLEREPLEILRIAAGIWYTERRDLLAALFNLLRAVVLDQGHEADLVAEIQKYLENLINAGLRQRIMTLIKELNREEPAGLGGPQSEQHIIDSRSALLERRAVVCRERLILCHCLVLSAFVVRMGPKEVKDVLSLLKDCATDVNGSSATQKLQIAFGLLFSLVSTFISDALSTVPDKASTLAGDTSFRREFHELVIAIGNDPNVEGFVDVTRLAWAVHLMLTQDGLTTRETISGSSSSELANIFSCLEVICSSNVFQFLLDKVLRTAAYQHDDEDMIYMYNAYMHKLMTCFLSHPLARDKVKEMKEKAMSALSAYPMTGLHDVKLDNDMDSQQTIENPPQPFVSLLELVSEIYQKEPHLLSGNEVLWTFVNFAGEDHTNVLTLVAFLKMLSTLASSQEGASKVWELLQGKTFRSVGWSTLFDCLSIYEERFKQSHLNSGTMLPEFEEGDAKALVAYLNVLQKVVENGNPNERKNWFPDIEPLFKLLSYENVPSYLKGALRNAIRVFIPVSPTLKDTIWRYLEQYDLPVVVGPSSGSSAQQMSTQVYDMRFELNEVESRMEKYPSTISFLNLLNALIAEERDVSDRGRRFLGIFRFVYDHVFGPFPQRAYADLSEKWQLVVVCLQHFKMILSMYDLEDEDIDNVVHLSQSSAQSQSTPLETQVPVLELLKDFMSGRAIFRNIMGILLPGVNGLIDDRTTQIYGHLLENAVQLSLEIIILVLEKDLFQPLDRILSQDQNQVVVLLEYVRYDFQPLIQQSSIKIMSILSSRMVGLVPLLLKSNAAQSLIEDYAACLELRSEESQAIEETKDDIGVLIIQLLIDNINRPPPNITHLLLKFHVDMSVERTVLQPKFHYSCLKVILDILENLSKPEVNALLHEFGFKLLYELCTDPLTSGPTMDLLSNKRYKFFLKHLYTIGVSALPKRNNNQFLRISSLHQRAWLLKLLALELHVGDMTASAHRETCSSILGHLFAQSISDFGSDLYLSKHSSFQTNADHPGIKSISKIKVLELLEVVQFRCPDTSMKSSQLVSNLKYELPVENILGDPATSEKGGVYHFSERGDRLINLASFCDKLWQKSKFVNPAMSSVGGEADIMDLRETIQVLVRWGWKYNKNLEEQAAQLHMLTSWSQIVEVTVSRRMTFLEDRSEILFEVLDASLSASASPDCSLKMASLLTQVSLTCMARLRDERFLSPGGMNSDNLTCLDVLLVKQLSNGACHSILFKLIMAILRPESSEGLRRRQYALLLSYFQYCRHMLDPDVPATVLHFLLREEQDSEEDLDIKKIDKEQSELAQANFSILRKEAQAILNLVTKDAIQGSEAGKTVAFYVLDAFISIDQERFFLGQLQSRGFLRSCLTDISNISSQRGFTLEAELAMLLRISHSYGKPGAQVLFSMGAVEHLTSCKLMGLQLKGGFNRTEAKGGQDIAMEIQKQRRAICSILRLVSSLTCLVDTSEFFEVKNKIVREVIDFVKGHQLLFDQVIREDVSKADELTVEQINLVVGILSKVWPYEENDEYGFVQGLFGMMSNIFTLDAASCFSQSLTNAHQKQRMSELIFFRLSFSLSSYLYFLVTKKSLRLQVSEDASDYRVPNAQRPRLSYLVRLLNSVTVALDRAAEEKSALLTKIRDINELSRQEVDEIISICVRQDCVSSTDNIHKRRYIAMVEMCQIAGNRDQLITLLLPLAEHVLNIFLVHFRERPSIPDSSNATKMISYGKQEPNQDISLLCGKLLPVLERLELLNEDKTGHSLKIFRRLLCSLKEMTIQRLST
ncbi:hypothetical protein MKW92_042800 [Papaver armeniacum]|nr:hypothetical protein MKW92_042800 [Papaver armeniacum]